jgi:hypothetical protein
MQISGCYFKTVQFPPHCSWSVIYSLPTTHQSTLHNRSIWYSTVKAVKPLSHSYHFPSSLLWSRWLYLSSQVRRYHQHRHTVPLKWQSSPAEVTVLSGWSDNPVQLKLQSFAAEVTVLWAEVTVLSGWSDTPVTLKWQSSPAEVTVLYSWSYSLPSWSDNPVRLKWQSCPAEVTGLSIWSDNPVRLKWQSGPAEVTIMSSWSDNPVRLTWQSCLAEVTRNIAVVIRIMELLVSIIGTETG